MYLGTGRSRQQPVRHHGAAVGPDPQNPTQGLVWITQTIGPQTTQFGEGGTGVAWFISDITQPLTFPAAHVYFANSGTYQVTQANYGQNPIFSLPMTNPPGTREVREGQLTWTLSFTGMNSTSDQIQLNASGENMPTLHIMLR